MSTSPVLAEPADPTVGAANPSRRARLRYLALSAAVGVVLAVAAGWVWVRLADPPSARVAANGGVYLGEVGLNQQAGVTLWFIVLGVALGGATGLALGWFGERFGWQSVVGVLVACVVATLGSRWLGQHVFGADPRAEAAHAQAGTRITFGVSLDTKVAYLGWPIGGLLGAIAAIFGWANAPTRPPSVAESSSVAPRP